MRRFPLLLTLALVLTPAQIMGQDPLPEPVKHLDMWVGDWTYTISSQDGRGSMSFEWFGDLLVRADEHTPGGNDILHMMGYDPDAGVYVWRRYWTNGQVDVAQGWLHDNAWTFLFVENVGAMFRMTMDFETPSEINFKWERSIEGGPWELLSEGKTTRTN